MHQLNLPEFEIRYGGTPEHPTLFDELRRKYVALTPEEWVRQHFVHYLINQKGYSPTLMANEVQLQIGNKTLRADSIVYRRDLTPRVVIEYKAPTVPITREVFNQIYIYNLQLHADYLIVSNGMKHFCCKIDYENKKCLFLEDIPTYENL